MRSLTVILLAMTLMACAKEEKEQPVCVEDPSPYQVTYPDGIERKSLVVSCTYKSGEICVHTRYVGNPNINFTTCK